MASYIATFFSHFGAIRFQKLCEGWGWRARMMPVPRSLSSSCGTCVRYEGDWPLPGGALLEEMEQIVRLEGERYQPVWRTEDG